MNPVPPDKSSASLVFSNSASNSVSGNLQLQDPAPAFYASHVFRVSSACHEHFALMNSTPLLLWSTLVLWLHLLIFLSLNQDSDLALYSSQQRLNEAHKN